MPNSIAVVEDDVLIRNLLIDTLRREGIQVVAETGTIVETARLFSAVRPRVVVLDLVLSDGDVMPHLNGWRQSSPNTEIIVLSSHSDDVTLSELGAMGVTCYISKRAEAYRRLIDAVKSALRGECIFSQNITSAVLRHRHNCLIHLTKTEYAMMELLGLGYGDDELAPIFGCSPNTVRTHRASIMHKFSLPNRVALMRWAFLHGFTRRRIAQLMIRGTAPDAEVA